MRLVDQLGFDPVDAGGLEESWRQQPGTPCYTRDHNAAQLKAPLASAERSRVPNTARRRTMRRKRSSEWSPTADGARGIVEFRNRPTQLPGVQYRCRGTLRNIEADGPK